MKFHWTVLSLALGVCVSAADVPVPENEQLADHLQEILVEARQLDGDVEANSEALRRARDLFAASFSATDPSAMAREWSSEGFSLEAHAGVWILFESPGERRGRGVFAWNPGAPASARLVAAPHGLASDDRLTAELAREVFAAGFAEGGAWSTAPRKSIDWTHTDASYFQEFTLAWVESHTEASVAQLHGFAQEKRRTDRGRESDVILSNGTRDPSEVLISQAACLRDAIPAVAVYPEVRELGATTNEQARAMRELARGTFQHVEMSYPIRRQLLEDRTLFEHWGHCLFAREKAS